MTPQITAVGLFCEDVRVESSGQVSLIGIFLDNLNVDQVPGVMPKLSVYARVLLPVGPPAPKKVELILDAWGQRTVVGSMEQARLQEMFSTAAENATPLGGVVFTAHQTPFVVRETGLVLAIAVVDDREFPCGQIRFNVRPRSAAIA